MYFAQETWLKAVKKKKIVRTSATFFIKWENVNEKSRKMYIFHARFCSFTQIISKVSIVDQWKLSGFEFRHVVVYCHLKIDAIFNIMATRQPRKGPCKTKNGNSRTLDYLPCFSYYRKMKIIFVICGKFYTRKSGLEIRTRTTPKFCCTV